jgi:hypothetical protein
LSLFEAEPGVQNCSHPRGGPPSPGAASASTKQFQAGDATSPFPLRQALMAFPSLNPFAIAGFVILAASFPRIFVLHVAPITPAYQTSLPRNIREKNIRDLHAHSPGGSSF